MTSPTCSSPTCTSTIAAEASCARATGFALPSQRRPIGATSTTGNGPPNRTRVRRRRFLKENILPIQESGQLKFVGTRDAAMKGERLPRKGRFPNSMCSLVNGHTDAMMIPHIHYKGRTVAFMADLLPSIHHIPLPWVMAYDTRPLLTMAREDATSWNSPPTSTSCSSSSMMHSMNAPRWNAPRRASA